VRFSNNSNPADVLQKPLSTCPPLIFGLHWFSDRRHWTWESMQKASWNRVPRRMCVLPMTWQFMIIMVPLSELETSTFQSEGVTAHLSICSFQMCSTQQDTFWTSHAARIVCQSLKPGGRIGQYLQNLTDVPFFRLDAIASPEDQEAGAETMQKPKPVRWWLNFPCELTEGNPDTSDVKWCQYHQYWSIHINTKQIQTKFMIIYVCPIASWY